MRTKTLLVTAALGAAGLMTASAQVYSVNSVGYVNTTLLPGYNLVANPLVGTNNHLNTILPLAENADGTTVFRFNAAIQNYYEPFQFIGGYGWYTVDAGGDAAMTIAPGEGFYITPFVNNAPASIPVTFVGEVMQGALSNPLPGPNQYAMRASQVPQSAPIGDEATSGSLLFAAEDGDTLFIFDAASQTYKEPYQYMAGYGWFSVNTDDPGPAGPTIGVGKGFFVVKAATATKTAWTRNFSVNP